MQARCKALAAPAGTHAPGRPRRAVVRRPTPRGWDRLRRAIVRRDGYRCQRCGRYVGLTRNAEVHHRDHDPGNNAERNLETLCKRCHIAHHRPPVAPDVAAWQRLIDTE